MFRTLILAAFCLWGFALTLPRVATIEKGPHALREIALALPELGGHRVMAIDPRIAYFSRLPTEWSPIQGSIVDTAIARGCDMILISPYEVMRNKYWREFRGDKRLKLVAETSDHEIRVFAIVR